MTRWLSLLVCLFAAMRAAASPQQALAAALADARTLPASQRVQTRYLDLSALPADYRPEAVKVLAFHANQLSRSPDLVPPRPVGDALLAVTLTDYGWKSATWDKLADIDTYYHVQLVVEDWWPGGVWPNDGKYYARNSFRRKRKTAAAAPWLNSGQALELATLTSSTAPLVRADWWFAQSSRQLSLTNTQTGAGYYDWLGIKDRKDFEKLVKLNQQDSIDFGKEMRAALEKSGVANEGRQVVRFQALGGPAWVTLDSDSSTDASNPVRLLGRGDYRHKAEEWYGTLANGLFAYFLSDDKGKRQDSAPDFIGADDSPLRSGRDARIHVCLACVRCHVEGLRPVDDWVRRTLRNPVQLQVADYAKFAELRRQYFSGLEKQLERDRQAFADAVRETNGLSVADNAKAFARLWDWYAVRERGAAEIAAEMGTTEDKLLAALKAYARKTGQLDLVLGGLLANPPSKLRVEHLEELQPELWKVVGYP